MMNPLDPSTPATCPPRPQVVYSPEDRPTLTQVSVSTCGATFVYGARSHLRRHGYVATTVR